MVRLCKMTTLFVDRASVSRFAFRAEDRTYGDVRRYYVALAPARAILVCRKGLELRDLANCCVDARLGYEDAWRDFVRDGNGGKRHTKVTVYRKVDGKRSAVSLSDVLGNAPRDDIAARSNNQRKDNDTST